MSQVPPRLAPITVSPRGQKQVSLDDDEELELDDDELEEYDEPFAR